MFRRPVIGWVVLWLAIVSVATPASAQITAFWQQQTITPQAVANDPQLASMQSWDLMTMTSGDWVSAGLRAQLPTGSFFYKHPLGGFKRPSPVAIAQHPALEFTPYVNTPNDNGLNNANTHLLGGFPEGNQMSIGDVTAPLPGTFSVSWGDLFADPPGTYQIARLTFPQELFPDVHDASRTVQVTPPFSTPIPEIPEPHGVGFVATAAVLALRSRLTSRRSCRSAICEALESRRLLTFSASFPGGATLAPRTDVNASNTASPITEGEPVIAVSPSDPLKVATYAGVNDP